MKKTLAFIVLFTAFMSVVSMAQEKKTKVIEANGSGYPNTLESRLGNDRYEIDSIVIISDYGFDDDAMELLRDCCENGRLTGIDMSRYTGLLGIVPNSFMSKNREDDGVTPRRINLKYITLPGSLNWIGDSAFAYTSLECVEIPTGVDNIGTGAFSGCANLKNVAFRGSDPRGDADGNAFAAGMPPDAVLHVCPGLGGHYRNSDSWKSFGEVREEDALFKSLDINLEAGKSLTDVVDMAGLDVDSVHVTGMLSAEDLALLKEKVQYGHLASLDLSGCEMGEDGNLCFCSISYLRMPDRMEMIPHGFLERSGVRHLTMPQSYDRIGVGSFEYCKAFPDGTLTVAEGCRKLDFQAFYSCRTINKIVLPSTMEVLEPHSLALTGDHYVPDFKVDLYVNRMFPPELTQYFEEADYLIDTGHQNGPFGCVGSCDGSICRTGTWRLFVPVGAKKNYENTDHWNHFMEIIETPMLTGVSAGIGDIMTTPMAGTGHTDGIYTTDGRMVARGAAAVDLSRGLYIVRENGQARKVLMGR